MFTTRPEIDGGHLPTAGEDRIGETNLTIWLKRAPLHGERARRRAGLRDLVDDSDANT